MTRTRVILATFTLALLTGSAVGSARAQGTPEPASDLAPYSFAAPFAPSPDLCTASPISTDLAAELVATPVATPEPLLTEHGIVALPDGQPADETTSASVVAVLTQFWACNNASNPAVMLGLFTEQGLQETIGTSESTFVDPAELRADVAAALTPGEPRPEEEWASIDAIVAVLQQDDGQVGALVLNTDPNVAEGAQVLDYFALAAVDSGFQIVRVILDPFDLTDGYGFEKAA
jgi:hypothetical protein